MCVCARWHNENTKGRESSEISMRSNQRLGGKTFSALSSMDIRGGGGRRLCLVLCDDDDVIKNVVFLGATSREKIRRTYSDKSQKAAGVNTNGCFANSCLDDLTIV